MDPMFKTLQKNIYNNDETGWEHWTTMRKDIWPVVGIGREVN